MPSPMYAEVVPATSEVGSITLMLTAPPEPASAVASAVIVENAGTHAVPLRFMVGVMTGPPGVAPAGAPTKASTEPLTLASALAPAPDANEMARFLLVAVAV